MTEPSYVGKVRERCDDLARRIEELAKAEQLRAEGGRVWSRLELALLAASLASAFAAALWVGFAGHMLASIALDGVCMALIWGGFWLDRRRRRAARASAAELRRAKAVWLASQMTGKQLPDDLTGAEAAEALREAFGGLPDYRSCSHGLPLDDCARCRSVLRGARLGSWPPGAARPRGSA